MTFSFLIFSSADSLKMLINQKKMLINQIMYMCVYTYIHMHIHIHMYVCTQTALFHLSTSEHTLQYVIITLAVFLNFIT